MMNTEKYYNFNEVEGYNFTHLRPINDRYSIAELSPKRQKSFYGKALILIAPFSSALFSYGTPIIARYFDEDRSAFYYHRLYDGGYEIERHAYGMVFTDWSDRVSPTTLRHIDAFCGMNKKQFMELPMDYDEARHWKQFYINILNGKR